MRYHYIKNSSQETLIVIASEQISESNVAYGVTILSPLDVSNNRIGKAKAIARLKQSLEGATADWKEYKSDKKEGNFDPFIISETSFYKIGRMSVEEFKEQLIFIRKDVSSYA